MTETLKQTSMITKGTYVDREMLSRYEEVAGEGGVVSMSLRGPLEDGKFFVRLLFNSVGQYKNFNGRMGVPQSLKKYV